MKFSKYNHEGYHDPTAYEALTHINEQQRAANPPQHTQGYRPLVYICSPYSDDILNNERKARVYSKFAVQQGAIPVTPHLLYPQFLDERDPESRKLGLFFALVLLGKCEELWIFGRHITSGMAKEIYKAETRKMCIRYFDEDCREIGKNDHVPMKGRDHEKK